MPYSIRRATITDIPDLVEHRASMFREMGIPTAGEMASAAAEWMHRAIPDDTYRAWVAETSDSEIAAGGGLIVIPWPPGPLTLDPRCGFIFNIYTQPAHRKHGLARRLMEAMHDHCRAEGVERVVLNASVFGKPLYDSMGYVVTNEPMMRRRI